MKIINFCLIWMAASILVTGCASQTHYAWQNYDQRLYNHYKNPSESDQFIKDLQEIIADGEKTGNVPPGIYAEYGYVLYENGNFPEAMQYFKKEQDAWPESRVLMTKMLSNVQRRSNSKNKQQDALATTPSQTKEVPK